MLPELTFKNGLKITWNKGDDGGGPEHYKDFLNTIPNEKRFNRCLEWCAGCSAISFSLLDAGIINELVVMDIYKPALDQVLINAKNNNLNCVTAYNIGEISKLPEHEKFDLIVANPPHGCDLEEFRKGFPLELTEEDRSISERIAIDNNWEAHKEFYKNITKHLNDGAELYISEFIPLGDDNLTLPEEAGFTLKGVYPVATGWAPIGIAHFIYNEKEVY